MASTDWPDDHGVSLPTMVSSTDLFDGELFGDELIDIYNSTVADEGSGVDNSIPHLLPPSDDHKDKDIDEDDHPGAQVAAAAAAMDDGLGAFRPSTSFNDLTNLLGPTAEASTEKTSSSVAPVAQSADEETGDCNKRAATETSSGPPTKRKATGVRGGRRMSLSKKQGAPVSSTPAPEVATEPVAAQVKSIATSEKADTPDPLSSEMVVEEIEVPKASKITMAVAPNVARDATRDAAPERIVTAPPMSSDASLEDASDADFKSIAQAAVSNLILSAGTTKTEGGKSVDTSEDYDDDFDDEKVDTSTAHIKALTGNNWVTACSGIAPGVTVVPSAVDSKANNRARRQNLTPDERARQNRDRNREHARNTRLRKKAYVEELKRTLTELVAQRDASEFEKRQAAQRELEQREVRFRVIEEFLKLRGRNEKNSARWSAILEEGFALTLPVTGYRKQVLGADGFQQTLTGVTEAMVDAGNMSSMFQKLGNTETEGSVTLQYECDRKNFYMDGCNAVLEWTGKTLGVVAKGSEIKVEGVIRGNFSPASNKLLAATILFDTDAFKVQIEKTKQGLSNKGKGENHQELKAAQEAANQADAILDSLQMPRLSAPVPAAVSVVHASSSSECSRDDKGEIESDDGSMGDANKDESGNAITRLAQHRIEVMTE